MSQLETPATRESGTPGSARLRREAYIQVNIDSITTSEIRISCAVGRQDVERALEAVCLAFDLDRPARQRAKAGK